MTRTATVTKQRTKTTSQLKPKSGVRKDKQKQKQKQKQRQAVAAASSSRASSSVADAARERIFNDATIERLQYRAGALSSQSGAVEAIREIGQLVFKDIVKTAYFQCMFNSKKTMLDRKHFRALEDRRKSLYTYA